MRQKRPFILCSLTLALLVTACSRNPSQPDFQKEISIFGYLHANRPLSEDRAFLITGTRPVTGYYDVEEAGIADAEVTVLEETSGETWQLTCRPENPGRYYNDSLIARPGRIYRLTVQAEGRTVTASTRVPPRLDITTELSPDSVNTGRQKDLGQPKPLFLECENPEQIILVDLFCNETWEDAEYIRPFHGSHKKPEGPEEYEGGPNQEPRHLYAMAPFRDLAAPQFENRNTVYWYSAMLVFYGKHTLQVLAVDDNTQRYLTAEHPEYSGGIEGGIGVFGSVSGEDFTLNVIR
ncbi:DUF4249 family protein [bacterium]|nr:DUF4249 family protein [bacterium]